jgi:lipopolysaccharide export system protein LptA
VSLPRARRLVWLCAGVALAAAVPAATAAPQTAPGLSVVADELQIDAQRQVAIAVGRVRITDGRTVATAARAVLYQREGRGVLLGEARAAGPEGVLEGREITVRFTPRAITRIVARGEATFEVEAALVTASVVTLVPAEDTVVAEGTVRLFTDPDVIATAARLVFRRVGGTITLDGRARVQSADGFVEADRIHGARRWDRIAATGDVHGTYRDTTVRSHTADVFLGEKRAVFAGNVRLTRADRAMTSERVTVWYDEGRVLAEGETWIRLAPQP